MNKNIKHRSLKCSILAATLAITGVVLAEAGKPAGQSTLPDIPQPDASQSRVQLAILLDTSSSMNGLIEQAKTQLWQIVNTFIDAKQNGQTPFVEVALYEYGNDGLSQKHWIRQIVPLTRDLDQVSEELFQLTTNGGEEYCGAVIRQAVNELEWDSSPKVYKAIFIAGNEPFTQGPVEANKACSEAIGKAVIVNTIHCGDEGTGVSTGWKAGATLAEGKYLVIDQNKAVVHVDAPQDAEIVKLNDALNKTYVAYGAHAVEGKSKQEGQDANALKNASSGAAVQRVATKASANYSNSSWDLVDASGQKSFDLAKVADKDLPPELKGKSAQEKKAWLEQKKTERADIQKKILALNKQREAFVAQKRKELSGKADTLDAVVTKAVREQAQGRGYSFEKK